LAGEGVEKKVDKMVEELLSPTHGRAYNLAIIVGCTDSRPQMIGRIGHSEWLGTSEIAHMPSCYSCRP
jgi:hypothetical protein